MAASPGRVSDAASVKSLRRAKWRCGLAVGEVLHLEVLQRLLDRLDAAEQRRHYDGGAELGRHAAGRDRAAAGPAAGGRR